MSTNAITASDIATIQKAFNGRNVYYTDVAALPTIGNVRYAREILGLMIRQEMANEVGDGDEQLVYVHPVKVGRNAKAARRVVVTSAGKCACGCGKGVTSKVNFRPGHDARMVSQLVSLVVRGGTKSEPVAPTTFTKDEVAKITGRDDIQERIDNAAYLVQVHFSDALSGKFVNAAMSAWAKYDKPARAKVEPALIEGTTKIGRWTYPCRRTANGVMVERNTKTNGTGEWVAV